MWALIQFIMILPNEDYTGADESETYLSFILGINVAILTIVAVLGLIGKTGLDEYGTFLDPSQPKKLLTGLKYFLSNLLVIAGLYSFLNNAFEQENKLIIAIGWLIAAIVQVPFHNEFLIYLFF